jgi:hypothetical protein
MMKRKGRNAAVSLQNKAIINAAQFNNRQMIFLFRRKSMKNRNDNNENNISIKSPLAGIHATDDMKRGCAQYINVPNKARFFGIENLLNSRNSKHEINPRSNISVR